MHPMPLYYIMRVLAEHAQPPCKCVLTSHVCQVCTGIRCTVRGSSGCLGVAVKRASVQAPWLEILQWPIRGPLETSVRELVVGEHKALYVYLCYDHICAGMVHNKYEEIAQRLVTTAALVNR